MRCIVTAGPTFEPLDHVRRLTNHSTGRLGSELVNYLAAQGHDVTLLIGQQATFRGERRARNVETFTTTSNLSDRLQALAQQGADAVFHAAAVSDFCFGKVWVRSTEGELEEIRSGKLSTRQGTLLAELLPTPKIILNLRAWFPQAWIVGWKYEVDGNQAAVIGLAQTQIAECSTNGCVANGPAYGPGFGIVDVTGATTHVENATLLYQALEGMLA